MVSILFVSFLSLSLVAMQVLSIYGCQVRGAAGARGRWQSPVTFLRER